MSFKGITIMTPEESLGNITAADDAAIFQSLIGSDGVLNIGSNFATTVISNNKVRVADGVLCVGGHMGRTAYGDYNDMTIENGVSGKKRNDIIYAKFLTSGSTDTFTLDVKKGTGTTGTAKDPALTQGVLYENATLREFPLWRVKLEGLSIVAVEKMFTVVPTIPELEAKYNELNSNFIGSAVSVAFTDTSNENRTINIVFSRLGRIVTAEIAGNLNPSTTGTYFNLSGTIPKLYRPELRDIYTTVAPVTVSTIHGIARFTIKTDGTVNYLSTVAGFCEYRTTVTYIASQ